MGIWTTFSFYEEESGCEILNENENENGTCCSCDDDQGNRNGTYTKIITQMEILLKTLANITLLTSCCACIVGNGNQTLIEICNKIHVILL